MGYYTDRFSDVNIAKVNKQGSVNFTHCTHSTEGIQIECVSERVSSVTV